MFCEVIRERDRMINIAIMNLEPKIHNTALMRISHYHKKIGDFVEWYVPLFKEHYDKIYCSALFDFTNKKNIPERAICGGSGFDLKTILPKEIENSDLDYTIYPDCDKSYIWFSRGCIRNCPFCIVRQKEGYIHPVKPTNLNPRGKVIEIMDNNFFANPEWRKNQEYLDKWQKPLYFKQGIDVRIFDKEQADFLHKYKINYIFIAWDNPKEDIYKHIKKMIKHIGYSKILCYVLIGYWSDHEENVMRIEKLKELKIRPFVMPYDKNDYYQMRFTRYVNAKTCYYKRMTFEEWNNDDQDKKKYDLHPQLSFAE